MRFVMHQYTHRVEVLSLLCICTDMGARRQFHKDNTLLSRVTRTIYSYKNQRNYSLHSDWFLLLYTPLKDIFLL